MRVGALRRIGSLEVKLAFWTVAVLTVVSAAIYTQWTLRERASAVSAKILGATMVADLFAESLGAPLDFGDQESIDAEFEHLRKNGTIIYAGVWGLKKTDPPLGAFGTGQAVDSIKPMGSGVRTFDDRVEIERSVEGRRGAVVGQTVLVFSLASENASFHDNRRRIFWLALLTMACTAGLLIAITRWQIANPLAKLAEGARRLGRGDLTARVAVRSSDEIGRLAQAFNAMGQEIGDREASLTAARQNLRDLFDHMQQAILAFDEHGLVVGEVSREATVLFGHADLAGQNVKKLLYPMAASHDVDAVAFAEWLEVAFHVGPGQWSDVEALAPREVVVPAGNRKVPLTLEFRPLVQKDSVSRIMMLATDVTEKRKLEQVVHSQEEAHARQMTAMRRLIAGGAQVFVTFVEGARERVRRSLAILGSEPKMLRSGEIDELFRYAHTIKGEAKAFDLGQLERATSRLEDDLDTLRSEARGEGFATTTSVHAELLRKMHEIRDAIEQGCDFFVAAAPTGRAALDQVTVQKVDLIELQSLVGDRDDRLGRVTRRLSSRAFGEATANLVDMVPTWAAHEGKLARVQVDGREVRVEPKVAQVLPGVLVHLVRNAIVHGIESPHVREGLGKAPTGLIQIAAEEGENGPFFTVQDDGSGLDVTHLEERAHKLGAAVDPHDPGALAFAPGVSTRSEASELAGRGVGLHAVRTELLEAGYGVDLSWESGRFTRLVLRPVLPLPGAKSALRSTIPRGGL